MIEVDKKMTHAWKLLLWGWLALSATGFLGCSLNEPPRTVALTDPPAFRPKGPQQVKTLPEALAAIMTVCSEDLELPRVEPLYVDLYRDAGSYAAYTGKLPRYQEDRARLTLALPHENRLHINLESKQGQSWGTLLRLLAHGYGHNVEYVLSASTQPARRWISEGFADWIAARVMDSLGWESYASTLSRAVRELSRYDFQYPELSRLESAADWAEVSGQPEGRIGTFDLAFYAVDRLVRKKGVAGMMNYFQSEDFAASFGLDAGQFELEVERDVTSLAETRQPPGGDFQAARPEWKTGYRWLYALKAPGLTGNALVPNEIVREDVFEDTPVYVLDVGKNEYPHDKETLSVLGTLSEGKAVGKNDPPSLPLEWPLKVGKRWRNHYVAFDLEHNQSDEIDTDVMVTDIDLVRVPAGAFPAFRIETYANGELISEQWYAPEARWFVKSRFYREDGVVEQSLVSFKAD